MALTTAFAQKQTDKSEKQINNRFAFLDSRGLHAIDLAAGSATLIDSDYSNSELDLSFRLGYKYHITSHLNINLTYNKYNVVIKDLYNEGYMSFDVNLEYLITPFNKFSPYIFVGGGYNASNYFNTTATKAQAGLGIEYMVAYQVGLKLFGEYNYMFTDELDGLIQGSSDDSLFRIGLGLNIYFGGQKKKEAIRKKMKTVINSNLIYP